MDRDHPSGRGQATSKDVAAAAGVAQSTVSYVMTGKRSVTADVRRRVEKAMRDLDYHPNAGARALRGAKTNVIALAVHLGADADVGDTLPYIDTIVEEARNREYEVVLLTTDEGPGGLQRLAGRRVADAFVLMDVRTRDDRLATAADLGCPVVLFGRPADSHGLDAVDFDTGRAAALLVDELAYTGHRHIVVVGDSPEADALEFRFISEFHSSARVRAQERGVTIDIVHRESNGWAGFESVADRILVHRDDRLGIIARTPRVTEWVVQLARLHGLVLGRDVSVVALCTDSTAREFDPAITNVSPEPRELSRRAMGVLFERIVGDDQPPRLELVQPRGITRRGSTTDHGLSE